MPFTQQRDAIKSRDDLLREPRAAFVSIECSEVKSSDISAYVTEHPQINKICLWHFDPESLEDLNLSLLGEWVLQSPSDKTLRRLSKLSWEGVKTLEILAAKDPWPEEFLATIPQSVESLGLRYSAPLADEVFTDLLKRCSNLQNLTLDYTPFRSRALDEGLKGGLTERLLELNLAGSKDRVLAGLGTDYTMPQLRLLDLDGCELHPQTLAQLQGHNCPNLEVLLAPACRGLDLELPKPLSFPKLKVLDFKLSHVRFHPGSHLWNQDSLPKLEELDLTRNLIRDEDAPGLAKFFESAPLRKIDLSQCCAFRKERYDLLLSSLPESLEELKIGGIYGPEPQIISGLLAKPRPRLRKLDVGETELNPELLSRLFTGDFPALQDLVIPIDGDEELELLIQWERAPKLENLVIYNSSSIDDEDIYSLLEDWDHLSVW